MKLKHLTDEELNELKEEFGQMKGPKMRIEEELERRKKEKENKDK